MLLTHPVALERHGGHLRVGELAGVFAENAERFRHAHDGAASNFALLRIFEIGAAQTACCEQCKEQK